MARLISLALRSGVEPKDIIKRLRGIACHRVAWHGGEKIHSCADAIAKALELNSGVLKKDVNCSLKQQAGCGKYG
ncbi:MAG: TSCPD domain-containing protein [bacterium]